MNCWKSIKLNKEFGKNRLLLISLLTGLLAFILLYVPFSITNGLNHANNTAMLLLLVALYFLPFLHACMHILPLILLNNRIKLIFQRQKKVLPIFTYYTNAYVTKKVYLLATLGPTILITLPGIIATYIFNEIYVYILLFTSVHIGFSFSDFLYLTHIVKAPRKAYIENDHDGLNILLDAKHS